MYKAHSKDINRNKSFHPLTFENLSKVERLQEKEAAKKEEQAKRQAELQRDQEERRYQELVHSGLGSGAEGAAPLAGGLLPVKRIFAAEYEKHDSVSTAKPVSSATGTDADATRSASSASHPQRSSFLSKFSRDASAVKHGEDEDAVAAKSETSLKREREEEHAAAPAPEEGRLHDSRAPSTKTTSDGATTGYVTTAEAARLRKEYELLKKQKVDPLRRVQAYENKTVATAAAARQKQAELEKASRHGNGASSEESAIRERIRKLMEMSKQK